MAHQQSKRANDWKLEGNEAIKDGNSSKARDCYTIALNVSTCEQEKETLKLNRALANLSELRFDDALTDSACMSSPIDELSEKALYRGSQALYGLERFTECREILKTLCEKYPQNMAAAAKYRKVQSRLDEQAGGVYDFSKMYKDVNTLKPPLLDFASYTGPVEVKPSMGRGRGLFTTKAVKAGDLLLCEKAFAHCPTFTLEETVSILGTEELKDAERKRKAVIMCTKADLAEKIKQKMERNPSRATDFASLCHGTYVPVGLAGGLAEGDNRPIMDPRLIAKIIDINGFCCNLSTWHSCISQTSPGIQPSFLGVWIKASYINHSCCGNVRRSFIGDFLLVRAAQDMPASSELTFWYEVPTTESYEAAQKRLALWGFECKCAVCIDLKTTTPKTFQKRALISQDLTTLLQNPSGGDLAKMERLLAKMEQTYNSPPHKVPRLTLLEPYVVLTRAYGKNVNPDKCIVVVLKLLDSLGFVIEGGKLPASPSKPLEVTQWGMMVNDVIPAWIQLWAAYAVVAPYLCDKAKGYAKMSYRICIGEDETFEELMGTWV